MNMRFEIKPQTSPQNIIRHLQSQSQLKSKWLIFYALNSNELIPK